MARLPDSRKKIETLVEHSKQFVDHSIEGLRTKQEIRNDREIVFPSVSRRSRAIASCTSEPLVTARKLGQWISRSGACLHCGMKLQTTSAHESNCVPLAKYKLDSSFWTFGQFCSPNCALGYASEHKFGQQVMTWTRSMLTSVFDCKEPLEIAPPRFMLDTYGGPLDSTSWKRTSFLVLKDPPLCTFAMYMESKKGPEMSISADTLLKSLRRPEKRDTELAKPTVTGREPTVLKVLAEEPGAASPKRVSKKDKEPAAKKPKAASGLSMFMDVDE